MILLRCQSQWSRWGVLMLAAGAALVSASDQQEPAERVFRKNLLRAHLGVRCPSGELDLRDDPSQWTEVLEGSVAWTIDLGRPRVFDRFSMQFQQLGGVCSLQASDSLIDPQWEMLGEAELVVREASGTVFELKLNPATARFVKLSIRTDTAGMVRALGLFGPMRAEDFHRLPLEKIAIESEQPQPESDPLMFSLANGVSWAQIERVSPGVGPMHRLRDEDVSTGYVFTRELRKGTDPPLFVLDLGAAPEIGRVVILHDDVPGSWLVAPADSDQPSRSLPVVGGTTAIDVLGIRAQHLHFYWSGDVPPGGLVVHEVAVFMKVGPPVVGLAARDPWRSNRVRPTLPGLGKLPVGGNPETGLPEIDPESP